MGRGTKEGLGRVHAERQLPQPLVPVSQLRGLCSRCPQQPKAGSASAGSRGSTPILVLFASWGGVGGYQKGKTHQTAKEQGGQGSTQLTNSHWET